MSDKTGGAAFPVGDCRLGGDGEWFPPNEGMTLLDYFAGQALPGLLAYDSAYASPEEWARGTADSAYTIAEAMLAEKQRARGGRRMTTNGTPPINLLLDVVEAARAFQVDAHDTLGCERPGGRGRPCSTCRTLHAALKALDEAPRIIDGDLAETLWRSGFSKTEAPNKRSPAWAACLRDARAALRRLGVEG